MASAFTAPKPTPARCYSRTTALIVLVAVFVPAAVVVSWSPSTRITSEDFRLWTPLDARGSSIHAPWDQFEHDVTCWTRAGQWVRNDDRVSNSLEDREREPYEWVPEGSCPDAPLKSFNRTAFCDILRGRPIHIIGDSMSRDFWFALQHKANADGRVTRLMGNEYVHGYTFRNDSAICYGTASGSSPALFMMAHKFYGDPMRLDRAKTLSVKTYLGNLSAMHGVRPSIVILNRGMHVAQRDHFLADVRNVLSFIREAFPDALVIWRSTPCPHPWCMNYTKPIASAIPREQLSVGHGISSKGDPISYCWPEVCAQVDVLRDEIARRWPGVVYMDVTTPMALRPDTHGGPSDCVHYRIKSLDVWLQLLFSLLLHVEGIAIPTLSARTNLTARVG